MRQKRDSMSSLRPLHSHKTKVFFCLKRTRRLNGVEKVFKVTKCERKRLIFMEKFEFCLRLSFGKCFVMEINIEIEMSKVVEGVTLREISWEWKNLLKFRIFN